LTAPDRTLLFGGNAFRFYARQDKLIWH
jgi:hypothetical protein